MFVRMKQNADNFMREAEKLRKENGGRQESPEKKPASPTKKASVNSAVVTNTATLEKDIAVAAEAKKNEPAPVAPRQAREMVKKDDKSIPVRKEAGMSVEKVKETVQEPGTNKMFYGIAAAAALGLGLYVGYRIYQGDTIEVAPVDAPAKPQI